MKADYSHQLAVYLKRVNPQHPASIEVITFAIRSLSNFIGTTIVSLLIAYFLQQTSAALLAMISFAVLRSISGGYHLKTSLGCVVATSLMVNIIPFIPVHKHVFYLMTFLSMLLCGAFGARNINHTTRIPEKYFPLLRILSVLVVSVNLLVQSNIMALSFFAQSLSLIQIQIRR